ncbi:MAG: glucokinase [Methylovirgula sp.]|jgi:glucokinase
MNAEETGLVGDIGGSNARFALVRADGVTTSARVYAVADYPSLSDAIARYLSEEIEAARPSQAVLAVAAPVAGDAIALTNHPWEFSAEVLRERFKFRRLRVINDFVANALAVPHLIEADLLQIGSGQPAKNAPIGVIGPGTGFGVSALVHAAGEDWPIETEGGHVTMTPADARESTVLDLMRKRFDHVSAERILSGPGLVNLYDALCELAHVRAAPLTPAEITDPPTWTADSYAREATTMFCAMLGTLAGNLALTFGARGGIYIAGGIVPKLGAIFVQSEFRARFEAKGRFRDYLAAIPTYVIRHPLPALLGAAALLRRER